MKYTVKSGGSSISFGPWVEDGDGWSTTLYGSNGGSDLRIFVRATYGESSFEIGFPFTEDCDCPVRVQHKAMNEISLSAVVQAKDGIGKWTDVSGSLITTAPGPSVRITPIATRTSTPYPTPTPTTTPTPGQNGGYIPGDILIQMSQVPLDIRRRAANLVSGLNGSDMTPQWQEARLGELAAPYYRPDVEGIAYYELQVNPMGRIVMSTGGHDEPIPYFSDHEKEMIAHSLIRLANQNGKSAVRLYKVDTNGYVAETVTGELASSLGTLPPKVVGLDLTSLDKTNEITQIKAYPTKQTEQDTDEKIEFIREVNGPQDKPFLLEAWPNWESLKAGYNDSYKVFAESLRREAAEEWKVEKLIQENGEGLLQNQTYIVPLLEDNAQFSLSGTASRAIKISENRVGGIRALSINVIQIPLASSNRFQININYLGGQQETLKFFIPDPNVIQDLGEDSEGSNSQTSVGTGSKRISSSPQYSLRSDFGAEPSSVSTKGWSSWSSWTIYSAGSSSDQRLYDQFIYGGCYSGCGPTAWAMLLGWADHQAAVGNPYWATRWGIYRVNGGYGSDADAPYIQDTGIENITKEINGYAYTFCIGLSGATYPWYMDNVMYYLSGRTGAYEDIHYSSLGIPSSSLREYARDSIKDRETPAIIGTGWLNHYPLAWKYAWRKRVYTLLGVTIYTDYDRRFYINPGYGGAGAGWITATTWFAGELYP